MYDAAAGAGLCIHAGESVRWRYRIIQLDSLSVLSCRISRLVMVSRCSLHITSTIRHLSGVTPDAAAAVDYHINPRSYLPCIYIQLVCLLLTDLPADACWSTLHTCARMAYNVHTTWLGPIQGSSGPAHRWCAGVMGCLSTIQTCTHHMYAGAWHTIQPSTPFLSSLNSPCRGHCQHNTPPHAPFCSAVVLLLGLAEDLLAATAFAEMAAPAVLAATGEHGGGA